MDGMEIRITCGDRDVRDVIAFDTGDAEPCSLIGVMLADALNYTTQSPLMNLAHAVQWCDGAYETGWPEYDAFIQAAKVLCEAHRKECDAFNPS